MFNIVASFSAVNMGKKAYYQVWTNLLHCMMRGTQKGKYLKN